MIEDDFDFSGYPKLGRPFAMGNLANKYIKFYLTLEEFITFEHLENNVKIYFLSHSLKYNRADHLRKIISLYDDVKFLNLLYDFETSKKSLFDPILKR